MPISKVQTYQARICRLCKMTCGRIGRSPTYPALNFYDANLESAILINADLSGADLLGANLCGVDSLEPTYPALGFRLIVAITPHGA